MLVFRKIKDPDNQFDQTDITMEVNHVNLEDVVQEFVGFLRACGYIPENLENYLSDSYSGTTTVVYVLNGEEEAIVYDTSKEARSEVNKFLKKHKDNKDTYWVDKVINGTICLDYDSLKDMDYVLEY